MQTLFQKVQPYHFQHYFPMQYQINLKREESLGKRHMLLLNLDQQLSWWSSWVAWDGSLDEAKKENTKAGVFQFDSSANCIQCFQQIWHLLLWFNFLLSWWSVLYFRLRPFVCTSHCNPSYGYVQLVPVVLMLPLVKLMLFKLMLLH